MQHKPSTTMTDRDGQFQRCWGCGARRKVAALGLGMWTTGRWCLAMINAGYLTRSEVRAMENRPPKPAPTPQELVEELFKQT